MEKTYVCNRYPFYSVRHLRFQTGTLTVTNEEDRNLVESLDYYGVFIHPQDGNYSEPAPVETAPVEKPEKSKIQRKPAKRKIKRIVRGKVNGNDQLHATGG
jgi:hypothetical protein